jgi:hypothetical protein
MKISAAFLAEGISIEGGVVDVRRGWPEWWSVETIPGKVEILVGVIVEFEQPEMGMAFLFDAIFRQEGVDLAQVQISVTPERTGEFVAGVPYNHPFWFKLSDVPVLNVGPCEIELRSGDESLSVVRVVLRLKPSE